MNRAKPIEAGCLALIVDADSEAFGRMTQVIGKNPNHQLDPGGEGYWYIDLPREPLDGQPAPDGYWSADNNQLLRIDDPDIQNQIESEKEEVIS